MKYLRNAAFLLGMMLIFQLHADCSIETDTNDDDQEIYILQNDLIRAVVDPSSSGRISEFMWQEGERHYFPELEYQAMEMSEGAFVVTKTNFAGFEDWIYEEGLVKQYIRYKAKILKNTPEECSVSVSCEKSFGKLERTMTIRKGSSVLEIETVITGNANSRTVSSFWAHIMIDVDRCANHNQVKIFIPTKKPAPFPLVKGLRKNKSKWDTLQAVPFDCVVERFGILDPAMADKSFAAQPWRAYIANDLLLGTVVPLAEIAPDGSFYNYIGLDNAALLSIETIYGARTFTPGKSHRFHQSLIGREWKHAVDYLDNNLVVAAEWHGKKEVTLTVGGFAGLKGVSCEVELLDNGKSAEKKVVRFGDLTPLTETAVKVNFSKEIADPGIKLNFRDASGKIITTSELLKRMKFPLK